MNIKFPFDTPFKYSLYYNNLYKLQICIQNSRKILLQTQRHPNEQMTQNSHFVDDFPIFHETRDQTVSSHSVLGIL